MQRDIQGEPIPGVERGDGIDFCRCGSGLGRIRLEEDLLEHFVDLQLFAVDGQLAGDFRRLEPPAQLQRGVHVDPAEPVVHRLESARGQIDREVADGELVRSKAAADFEGVAFRVLEMQRFD